MTIYPSATRTCRKQNVMHLWTLFYPGRPHLSMGVFRNRITASAGNALTVSLSGDFSPSARNAWAEVRVSSGSTSILVHVYKMCKGILHCGGQFLPWLKP